MSGQERSESETQGQRGEEEAGELLPLAQTLDSLLSSASAFPSPPWSFRHLLALWRLKHSLSHEVVSPAASHSSMLKPRPGINCHLLSTLAGGGKQCERCPPASGSLCSNRGCQTMGREGNQRPAHSPSTLQSHPEQQRQQDRCGGTVQAAGWEGMEWRGAQWTDGLPAPRMGMGSAGVAQRFGHRGVLCPGPTTAAPLPLCLPRPHSV